MYYVPWSCLTVGSGLIFSLLCSFYQKPPLSFPMAFWGTVIYSSDSPGTIGDDSKWFGQFGLQWAESLCRQSPSKFWMISGIISFAILQSTGACLRACIRQHLIFCYSDSTVEIGQWWRVYQFFLYHGGDGFWESELMFTYICWNSWVENWPPLGLPISFQEVFHIAFCKSSVCCSLASGYLYCT